MGNFSYSFCMSLLHSLWQAALLMLVYAVLEAGIKKHAPAFKRNLLYVLLLTQCILAITTFFVYYTGETSFYEKLRLEKEGRSLESGRLRAGRLIIWPRARSRSGRRSI